jgi:hypothetical protein
MKWIKDEFFKLKKGQHNSNKNHDLEIKFWTHIFWGTFYDVLNILAKKTIQKHTLI